MSAPRALMLLPCCLGLLFADLAAVRAEPDAEKRSEMALKFAEAQIDTARKAWDDGDLPAFRSSLGEVAEAAELSYDSLDSTGKRARRSPKYFKRAEQKLRLLIRRIDGLEKAVGVDERAPVAAASKRLHDVQDRVLNDIMGHK